MIMNRMISEVMIILFYIILYLNHKGFRPHLYPNNSNTMKLRVLSFTTGLVEKVIPKFSTFDRRRLFPEWRGF